MKLKLFHLLLVLLMLGGVADAAAQQLAFPGAQGWGRFATGGRTGSVYHVTNLNDSGSGSLRDAISKSNRIIVFDVAGVIKIESRLVFSKNLYVAGQTAPGEGITVYGNGVAFSGADNIIVRYMRFRMGSGGDSGKDCAGIANGKNMIFDHCSFSWGLDETFSINGMGQASDITLSNCIVGQGLQSHCCGGLMQAENITLYRILYCDNDTRNPKVKGINQYVNNIVYNWKSGGYIMGGESEGHAYCNIESNMFINGPESQSEAFSGGNGNFHFYGTDNWQDKNQDGEYNPYEITNYSASDRQESPYDYPELEKWTANQLVDSLLPTVGASLPYRDYTDCYMVEEVMSFGKKGAFISREASLPYGTPDTWNVYKGETRVDTDKDGMPDAWEKANGTDVNKNDAMTIAANGYTNIENYINSISRDDRDFYLRAPMLFEQQKATTSTVTVTWSDWSDNEDGFAIELEKNGAYAEVARVGENVSTYTFTNLEAGTSFNVRVRAYAGDKYSEYLSGCKITTRPIEVGVVDIDTYVPELTWTDGATAWDFTTQAWNNSAAAFADGKDILFAPKSDAAVTLNETVTPKTVVVNSDADVTISGAGAIAGETSVNKGGSGTLTLNTKNTYTGATVLHDGVLEFNTIANGGSASSIGASKAFAQNWIFDGGTYRYTGVSATTDRSAKMLSGGTLEIANSGANLKMNGTLEGAGDFTLSGSGLLTVNTAKFFGHTGATILEGGTMYLSTAEISNTGIGTSSKLVFAGGHLKTKGENNNNETYSFPIEVKSNTYSQFSPHRNCYIAPTVSGTGTLQLNIPYLREYVKGDWSGFTGKLIANGVSSDKDGSLLLFDTGVTDMSTFVIELKGNARVLHWKNGSTTKLGGLSGDAGTQLRGATKNTKGFTMKWIVGGANTDETFKGVINNYAQSNSYVGSTSIAKVGTGYWRLTGNNDYSGTTQVAGGTLIVNGKNSGTGTVTVAKGATLKGTGTVGGATTVQNGGIICGGDTLVDGSILRFSNGCTLNAGAIVEVPLSLSGTTAKSNKVKAWKKLVVNGATLSLDMENVSGEIADGQAFTVFDFGATPTVSGTGFTTIIPEKPSETQVWDISEVLTTGKIYVRNAETGINDVKVGDESDAPKYNLQGMRIVGEPKGVYIQNGKMYVAK